METILLKYINEQVYGNQTDGEVDAQDDLLGGGILDSLGMMKFILFIETESGIKIPPEDMTIENFMNIETITEYISEKRDV